MAVVLLPRRDFESNCKGKWCTSSFSPWHTSCKKQMCSNWYGEGSIKKMNLLKNLHYSLHVQTPQDQRDNLTREQGYQTKFTSIIERFVVAISRIEDRNYSQPSPKEQEAWVKDVQTKSCFSRCIAHLFIKVLQYIIVIVEIHNCNSNVDFINW